jgi:predicted CXXCH cytochrome family protein
MAAALVGLPATAFAVITGSAHDLSSQAYTTEICNVCHTPHDASATAETPLWNHDETGETFTVYSSVTLDAGALGQPAGVSKLCLSCHDGSVAIDSFGGVTGTTYISATNEVGTVLANDHPISFVYDAALVTADGELEPITAAAGTLGTIDEALLIGGNMECSSCHDVHSRDNIANLLQIDNAASALCLTCHIK